MEGLQRSARDRHYMVLVLAAGLLAGVMTAWQSLLQAILSSMDYNDTQIGYLGFANGLSGNLGSVCIGAISDRWFQRRFKRTILLLLVWLFLTSLWFTLSLPALGSAEGILPASFISLTMAASLSGSVQSATSPLFYELCAELTYPVPEGTSAGFLAFLWNFCLFYYCGSTNLVLISPYLSTGLRTQDLSI